MRRGWIGLEIRIVGVGRDGVVEADDVEGLGGSMSSRLRGRRVDRKIFLRPARVRIVEGDLGGVLGIEYSDTGDTGNVIDLGVVGLETLREGVNLLKPK